jgi:hypothetical protein
MHAGRKPQLWIKTPTPVVFKAPPVTYASAETRGKLRAWKTALARKYHEFDCAYHHKSLLNAVEDFAKRSSEKGRRRAFAKIKEALGSAPTLEYLDMDKRPIALWSVLNPREAVAIEGDPGQMQDCVTVNYLIAGAIPDFGLPNHRRTDMAEGLWTLEIPDHALGRAIERSGVLPDQIIREAHDTLLELPLDKVSLTGEAFLLKAGKGGFICQFSAGQDASIENYFQFHVRAPTWISDDMMGPNQEPLSMKGAPGKRLGDTWLRPRPFVRIKETPEGDGLTLEIIKR